MSRAVLQNRPICRSAAHFVVSLCALETLYFQRDVWGVGVTFPAFLAGAGLSEAGPLCGITTPTEIGSRLARCPQD